jgi:FHS family L-fucose permease-like MFS transporter
MKKENSMMKILPVMFGFFIMGFVDIIGMATNYVKNDFSNLSDTMVNLISLSCFLWFFILSIPTGMLMNKIGRKKTVAISFCCHVLAMCLPLITYSFSSILIAFSLIGIGNTILQVSLNPLVTDVVTNEKLTGTLTLGQFIKAVSSFIGPILTAWVAGSVLGWKMIFPIYAGLSFLALLWLWFTPIQEVSQKQKEISIKVTASLFKDKFILAFFIGILVLVGVDVSINMTFPKFLMERCHLELTNAGMGNSVYFFARTIGAFIGGILLMKYSESKFFIYSVWIALIGIVLMIFGTNVWFILGCVAIFGIGYANLFSIIFSLSLKRVPEKANEVSALLIVGVCGGAILPPIIGIITDSFHSQLSAIIVLAIVWCYMIWLMRKIKAA